MTHENPRVEHPDSTLQRKKAPGSHRGRLMHAKPTKTRPGQERERNPVEFSQRGGNVEVFGGINLERGSDQLTSDQLRKVAGFKEENRRG